MIFMRTKTENSIRRGKKRGKEMIDGNCLSLCLEDKSWPEGVNEKLQGNEIVARSSRPILLF